MAQSLSSILIHLVFSTKDRQPVITTDIDAKLHAYMAGTFHECKCPSLLVGGTFDHIHALFSLHRTWSTSDVVEEVKKSSSKWIKTQGPQWKYFHWQAGYGAFSIGQSGVEQVKKYIANQKQHHHRVTFQNEFRGLLKKYQMEYDERYVWD
jgi:REP element-mobilizing transposase RayT